MDIILCGPTGVTQIVSALVDTGADYPIFDKYLAGSLGINLEDDCKFIDEPLNFGTGKVTGRRGRVGIGIEGKYLYASAIFVPKMPFSFSLLGRISVFDKFNSINFVEDKYPGYVEFT